MMNDGNAIGDGSESHVRREQGSPSSEPSTLVESPRSRPGILIFSRGRQLLHMNSRALELTGHLNQVEIGSVHDLRSAPVRELSAQIQEMLDHRKEADIREIFELKRVIFDSGRKILVRGFGLAGQNSHDDSRIVIILEEVGLRQEHELRRRRRGSSILRAVAPSPRNQHNGDPKEEVSDARKWVVCGPSPSLDRMRGVRITESGL